MKSANTTTICFFLEDVRLSHEGAVYGVEIFTCVLNAFLPIVATSGNLLTIFVIYATPSLHTQQNVFLACLATSNFVLAAIVQPSYVVYKVSEMTGYGAAWCHSRVVHWFGGFTCAGVSILTITALAVDRFLAIHLHLTYITTVTVKRCVITAVLFWVLCFTAAISVFFMNSDRYWTVAPIPILFFSLFLTTASHVKVFRTLGRHERQIQVEARQSAWNNGSSNRRLNVTKYKKSAIITLYILLLFVVSNIPFLVTMVIRIFTGYTGSVKLAYELEVTVVYASASLNPVLYCWRLRDIRQAVLSTLRKLRQCICCCRLKHN